MWHQKPFSLSWSNLSRGGIKWNQDWYRKNAEAVCYFSLSWLCLSFVFLLIFKVILNFFIFWTINPYLLFSSFDLSVHLLSCSVTQSCPTLCNPMDCSLPGSSVHGIFQARMLEWIAIPFSRGSSQPRDWTQITYIAGRFFIIWFFIIYSLLSLLSP